MPKTVTIKDIAKKLNIHHTTVSRALRDHPDVHPRTREKVQEAARQMNYRPNFIARNLKNPKTNLIGLIVPEIKHHFFAAVVSGVEDIASQEGYVILLCQSNEDCERERQNVDALISSKVAGLLVSISQNTCSCDHFRYFENVPHQLVFFDRICESPVVSKVVVDDYNGAYVSTKYLIDRGHTRIAHLGGTEHLYVSKQRHKGFIRALKDHHIPESNDYVVYCGFQESDGVAGMEKLLALPDPPRAVVAVNDPVAIGAYETVKRYGLRIPEDIAIIGFSDNPVSGLVNPPLSTVSQPAYEMGKEAAKLLIKQIKEGGAVFVPQCITLKTELIPRDSA